MMNPLLRRFGLCAVLSLAVLVISGCSSCKPGDPGPVQTYTVQIDLDPGLANDSVRVDVVGVTSGNQARWENYSMTKYWQQDDEMRQDASKVSLNFGRSNPASQTIGLTSAIWKTWLAKGVTHVAVVADLPGIFEDKPEPQDARRQIFSICKCSWPDKTNTINISVKRSGVEVTTVPRQVR